MGLNRQDCQHLIAILNSARITGAESETIAALKSQISVYDRELEAAEFNVKFDQKIEAQRLAAVAEESQRIEKIGRELAEQSEGSRLEAAAAELIAEGRFTAKDAQQPYDPAAQVPNVGRLVREIDAG